MPHDRPTPAVSVLMPVYNGERFLAEAIDSILGQTFTDFEFVIIDDGSTDASPAILADYASRDPRIRVLRQANAGIVAALNRGLTECRAPLVARMDADDVCLPQRLAAQVNYLTQYPDLVAVGTAFQLISASGERGPIVRNPSSPRAIARGLRSANRLAHPTVMMRRDAVLAAGGYREALRHAEDYDLWARLSLVHKLANLSECLLLYRIHTGQISWEQSEAQAIATLAVRAIATRRLQTGRKPSLLPEKIDHGFLSSLGVSSRDRNDAIVACVAGRISDYAAVKMNAEEAATRNALLEFAQRSGSRSIRRSVTARLAWGDFVAARRNRHWLNAILSLGTCALAVSADSGLVRTAVRRVLSARPGY